MVAQSSDSKKIAEEIRKNLPDKDSRIVFVSGNFNIIHPGHLRLLRFAAECGDFLVVGVQAHSNERDTHVPEGLRLEGVDSIGIVNFAFLLKDRPEDFIRELKPHTVVKGKEHEENYNPEQAVVDEYGGGLLFGSGEVSFSTSDLIEKEFSGNRSNILKPHAYLKRHGIENSKLRQLLMKFSGLKITVVGDLIVDEYVSCDALGMSREDPVIVVSPNHRESYVGGAGIVAAHASGLGASVNFVSVAGADSAARFADEKLTEYGVTANIFVDESRPTSLKTRFRVQGKTVFRVSELRQHAINKELMLDVCEAVKHALKDSNLLIFSDFNYGCLPQWLVDEVTGFCVQNGLPIVADSQSSSQVGDVSRYKKLELLTPTEHEARLALKDFESGLVILAEELRKITEAKNVLLKMGSEGVLVHAYSKEASYYTDQLPALNTSPKDVAGAGDSLLTSAAMATVCGANIWESAYIGSLAAACQVAREGNVPLKLEDIFPLLD